jgi:ribosomal protein S18 acetylase RimI-like enzyme
VQESRRTPAPRWRVTCGEPAPATVERLLRSLPDWFGIESAVEAYVAAAARKPAYLAWPASGAEPAGSGPAGSGPAGPGLAGAEPAGSGSAGAEPAGSGVGRGRAPAGDWPAGVLLASRHFPRAAEIYLMAVDPAVHRRGAGRALVVALEADLIADGVEFLQVKTLGPTYPDAGYERTRRFYTALGFQPLEEIPDLWPGNPCLIMIKCLPPRTP